MHNKIVVLWKICRRRSVPAKRGWRLPAKCGRRLLHRRKKMEGCGGVIKVREREMGVNKDKAYMHLILPLVGERNKFQLLRALGTVTQCSAYVAPSLPALPHRIKAALANGVGPYVGAPTAVGANNDINVLDNSPLFDNLLEDKAPATPFVVNGVGFEKGYYLADGIYPQWATFVKSFTVANDAKHSYFKKRQESERKDVERAFGVLQGGWGIMPITGLPIAD
nr:protein ALP1-like [Tanacetum cinerariifolium]